MQPPNPLGHVESRRGGEGGGGGAGASGGSSTANIRGLGGEPESSAEVPTATMDAEVVFDSEAGLARTTEPLVVSDQCEGVEEEGNRGGGGKEKGGGGVDVFGSVGVTTSGSAAVPAPAASIAAGGVATMDATAGTTRPETGADELDAVVQLSPSLSLPNAFEVKPPPTTRVGGARSVGSGAGAGIMGAVSSGKRKWIPRVADSSEHLSFPEGEKE
eukprot:TRINITY_DN2647_c0_g2_i2.p1 TRINITY_DN2647_c0_g2~~TRINITY_DN2647_c0_g2_i2.p1  ORF type:complete len:216 (-),score=50.34 TRINITY_DN2647_c0_g2_i2:523-1170(-)